MEITLGKYMEGNMRKQVFITEEESRKCRKVAEAFTELYESDGTAVLDAGKYGFVKLQYYNINNGFDCVTTYTDSSELFNSLWEDWLYINLLEQIETPEMENMGYNEIIRKLPQEKQAELLERKEYFLKKCSI